MYLPIGIGMNYFRRGCKNTTKQPI
jgi:hypothetical protein